MPPWYKLAHSRSKGTGSDQKNAIAVAGNGGLGGNGGPGEGPQLFTLPIGDTLGRKIEIPSMSLAEFCEEYELGDDIYHILNEAELDIGGLIVANDLASQKFGLKLGQVAEVKWALKAMLLKCPAVEEVPIRRGLYHPNLMGGIGGDGGLGVQRGGAGGVGAASVIDMNDLFRFRRIMGGIGGAGGPNGLRNGKSGAYWESSKDEEGSNPSYAENNGIAGGHGGSGGWGHWLGGEGGVGGAPIIPLEAIGEFQWIQGGRGGNGGAGGEFGGKGGKGEAPKFPKPLAVIEHATRLQVQAKNMKLRDGEKLRKFKFNIDQKLLDRLYDHGFQSVGALFEIRDIDLDEAPFKPGNKYTLGYALGEFMKEVNKNPM